MKFSQFIESFYDAKKFSDYYHGNVEVYKNPTGRELMTLFRQSYDSGVRLGLDKQNNIYAWIEDILHSDIEKRFKLNFILRFEYTKGRSVLFLSSGETAKNFKKYTNEKLISKLKSTFPLVKKIETSTTPAETIEI